MTDSEQSYTADSPRGLLPLWGFLILLGAALIYPYTPLSDWIFCPFRAWTGFSCAGCGMTRSVTATATGDLMSAFRFHPAGPLLVLSLFIAGILRFADYLTGRTVLLAARLRATRCAKPLFFLTLVLVLTFWGWRLYGESMG